MRPILYDLSPPLESDTPVWPGDTPLSTVWNGRIGERGSPVNLSSITTTVHLASHADAPLHTESDGLSIDRMPLDLYVGRCRVIYAATGGAGDVEPADIPGLEGDLPRRLLIRTGCPYDLGFPSEFAAISPALAERLVHKGVRLVGTDAPSVDPLESKELLAHHTLLGHGIAILEGLDLRTVPAGEYELIALPLPLVGLDASPVRAVLRALPREPKD